NEEENRKKALGIFDPPRFGYLAAAPLGEVPPVGQSDDAGRDREHEQDEREVHRVGGGERAAGSSARATSRDGTRTTCARRRSLLPQIRVASVRAAALGLISRRPAGSRGKLPAGSRRFRRH